MQSPSSYRGLSLLSQNVCSAEVVSAGAQGTAKHTEEEVLETEGEAE